MSRYIVDILGVGLSRYDFCKRKSFVGKIGKNRPISAIYRYMTDISDTKLVINAACEKMQKKCKKKK